MYAFPVKREARMKIIAIANQKGGCGKTTTAINLASALSLNGKRVLLLDLDPQAHASLGLNIDAQDSIYNVISHLTPRSLKIEDIIKRIEDRFDLVPSNILVGTLEQELADEIGRELKLTGSLTSIRTRYDYILIDCPPSLGFLTVNAIRASDEMIIPVETSRFSLQGVAHLTDIINLVRDRLNHPVSHRVLVTMFDSRLRHSFEMMNKMKEQFPSKLFDTIIHINVKLKESAVLGETVAKYDKYSRGAKDYFSLAREMLSTEIEEQVAFTPLSERMQDLVKLKVKELEEVTFFLKNKDAESVYVTGSFNDWSLDDKCKMQKANGNWRVSLPLNPGCYKYQFIIDGKWCEDPANPRQERNSFGDINSLIEVKG